MKTADAFAALRPRPSGPPLRGRAPLREGITDRRLVGRQHTEQGTAGSTLNSPFRGRRLGVGAPYGLTTPAALKGEIETAGDKDWYSFEAYEGLTYTFTVELVSLLDSYLELCDAEGNVIVFNDDSAGLGFGSRIVWKAPETGRCLLAVRAVGDLTGIYRLSLDAQEPTPTPTATEQLTNTPTATEVSTDTPTVTNTPTITDTPSITPTPTPFQVMTVFTFDTDGDFEGWSAPAINDRTVASGFLQGTAQTYRFIMRSTSDIDTSELLAVVVRIRTQHDGSSSLLRVGIQRKGSTFLEVVGERAYGSNGPFYDVYVPIPEQYRSIELSTIAIYPDSRQSAAFTIDSIQLVATRIYTPTPTPTVTHTPTDTPTNAPTPTQTPTGTPTPTETPTLAITGPDFEITTLELLRRTRGGKLTYTVMVEGVNGFDEQVRLQVTGAPQGFRAQIVPSKVKPPAVARLMLIPIPEQNPFADVGFDGAVKPFTIQGLSADAVRSVEVQVELRLPDSQPRPEGDVVYREQIPIYLASTSTFAEEVGDTVKIQGQIRSNPGVSQVQIRAKRPGDKSDLVQTVQVAQEGGRFEAEFAVESVEHLVSNPNDEPWQIDAFFDVGLFHLPLNGRSETLLLPVGGLRASLGNAKFGGLIMAGKQSDALESYTGHIVIVGGAASESVSAEKVEELTYSLYTNLRAERRLTGETLTYLARSSTEPTLDTPSSLDGLRAAVAKAEASDFLLIYLVGAGGDGFFELESGEFLNAPLIESDLLAGRLTDSSKRTLLIVDTHQAGAIRSALGEHANLETIASTGAGAYSIAIFGILESTGQPFSFSDVFFDALLGGKTVGKALQFTRKQLRRVQEPMVLQVPEPLDEELPETFASLVIGSAFVPEGEEVSDNLPPAIRGIPATLQVARGYPLSVTAVVSDEEGTGANVILSARITKHGMATSHEVPAVYNPATDVFSIDVQDFPDSLFGQEASEGLYSLSLLVQDDVDNSRAPAISSVEVVPAGQTPIPTPEPTVDPALLTVEFDADDLQSGRLVLGDVNGYARAAVTDADIPAFPGSDGHGLAITANPGEGVVVFTAEGVETGGEPAILRVLCGASAPGAQVALVGLNHPIDGQMAFTNPTGEAIPVWSSRELTLIYAPPSGGVVPFLQMVVPPENASPVTVYFDRLIVESLEASPMLLEEIALQPPGDFESGTEGMMQNIVSADGTVIPFGATGDNSILLSITPDELAANFALIGQEYDPPGLFWIGMRARHVFGDGGMCMIFLTNGVENSGLFTFNSVLGTEEATLGFGADIEKTGPIPLWMVVQNAGPGVQSMLEVDDCVVQSVVLPE